MVIFGSDEAIVIWEWGLGLICGEECVHKVTDQKCSAGIGSVISDEGISTGVKSLNDINKTIAQGCFFEDKLIS